MNIDSALNISSVSSTDVISATTAKSAASEAKQAVEEANVKKNVDTIDFSNSTKETTESIGIYSRSTVSIKNESMKEMVQKLIGGQIANSSQSSFTTQINEMLKEKFGIEPVEHNDAEDKDYWNAENTANRILEFAKTLSGGNAEVFNNLKDSFDKAFSECESIWGDKLPDVCYNTKELVTKGFEDMYNEMKGTSQSEDNSTTEEVEA